jgi:hypothetical protein
MRPIEDYLDNTATPDNYLEFGVLRFARDFLPPCKEFEQSLMHYWMMRDAIDLYNPKRRYRPDRQMYNLVHREGAKTTHFSYVFPLYVLCTTDLPLLCTFEDEVGETANTVITHEKEFVLIVSETSTAAERMTTNIRTELSTNRLLASYFGDLTPRSLPDDPFLDQVWRRNMFKLANGSFVVGLGSGQQIRGINVGMRPSLLIADDIYSQKSILTEETREKTRYWFFAEAVNTVDSQKGKIITIGTIVHADTVLVDVQNNSSWYGRKYPLIAEVDLSKALSACTIDYDRRTIELPSRIEIQAMHDACQTLSWKDRLSLEYVLLMYKDRFEGGRLNQFYQEMMHILQSPDDEAFTDRLITMSPVETDIAHGHLWCSFQYQGYEWKGIFEGCLGIDIAASESGKADNTACMVVGYCHAYPQIDGFDAVSAQAVHKDKKKGQTFPMLLDGYANRMDIYDNERVFGTTKVQKKGIVNQAERFALKYKLSSIVAECTATQSLVARELRRYINTKRQEATAAKKYYPMLKIIEEVPTNQMKKEERIKHSLLPIMQGHKTTIINTHSQACLTAWQQLRLLGVGDHDDEADAASMALIRAKKPLTIDYQAIGIKEEQALAKKTIDKRQYPFKTKEEADANAPFDWETM